MSLPERSRPPIRESGQTTGEDVSTDSILARCAECGVYDSIDSQTGDGDRRCWKCATKPLPKVPVTVGQLHEAGFTVINGNGGGTDPDRFGPAPLDYPRLIAEGIPPVEYLDEPYIPAGASIWAAGSAESGKSMWALHAACRLSRAGVRVIYISQENPQPVELHRLERLAPNPDLLQLFHYQGIDLAQLEHREWLFGASQDAGLVILDTLTAAWSGDENDNAALVAFDRDVIRPLVGAGITVLTLDHTGHPVPFTSRKGVSAPRGASSKGQKADFVLEFRDEGGHRFTIRHGKDRVSGTRQPDRTFEVIDTEDGRLDVVEVENAGDERVRETTEAMVAYVLEADHPVGTNELREAMKGIAGKDIQTQAMKLLRAEDPPRLTNEWGHVETTTGRKKAKVWLPANRSEPVRNQSGSGREDETEPVPTGPFRDRRTGSSSLAMAGGTDPAPDRTGCPDCGGVAGHRPSCPRYVGATP